jgi:type II secretory pathway pseudopilin PulG/DnaJ-domain-containing protein 1
MDLESGAKLVRLALANYRGENQTLPDAERVESMLLLIRIANADQAILQWAEQLTGASADKLQRCAIAFIEQSFFAHGKDDFAILGLNPWASALDIKEHYRLLIRIFHPDRNNVASLQAARYSAMINQAYTTLKTAIPQVLTPVPPDKLAKHASATRNALPRTKFSQAKKWAWQLRLQWLTPIKVMMGLVSLVALCITLGWYSMEANTTKAYDVLVGNDTPVDNLPAETLDSPNQIVESALAIAAQADTNYEHALQDNPPEDDINSKIKASVSASTTIIKSKASQDILRANSADALKARVAVNPSAPTAKHKFPNSGEQLVIAGSAPVNASNTFSDSQYVANTLTPNEPTALMESKHWNVNSDKVTKAVETTQTPLSGSVRVTEPAKHASFSEPIAAKPVSTLPNDFELRELIAKFTDSYQRGDIQAFMFLFADDVDAMEEGGRLGLQDTYGSFFNNTQSRQMMIRNLDWKLSGNVVIGMADYRSAVFRKNSNEALNSSGAFRFKVTRAEGKIKIVSFYHAANAN